MEGWTTYFRPGVSAGSLLQVGCHKQEFMISQAEWPREDVLGVIRAVYPLKKDLAANTIGASNGAGTAIGVIAGIAGMVLLGFAVVRVKTGHWWPFGEANKAQELPVEGMSSGKSVGSIGPLVGVDQDYVVQLQEMYTHQDAVELPAEELGYQPSMLKSSRVPSPSLSGPAAIQDV
ncbi:hypothetical protein FPQ18DRAFT_383805 [Pyronema domesticum]|uniref:Uncharacterized protein n=1 Tax=Pyronema omphalodes (strain CBS 100304) TaxID=1076935 RepID=U4L232_PYROM|nr:hypothetical protein FPQ18DRAFT_383805 [Pyronema domesticum]CCX08921.1 Protein of unknown function [Pyronema omphalodes CBS 100304]